MNFRFGTKGETLERLNKSLANVNFCKQIVFSVEDWRSSQKELCRKICTKFENELLAIRSSARDEDTFTSSKAGAYLSVTDVAADPQKISDAIERVIASYDLTETGHQLLIQPMVRDVAVSGVVLSRDLDTLSPYYAINYDDWSGRTDTVTGGAENKALLVFRDKPEALNSRRFRRLIEIVRELEFATQCDEIDVEFCITKDERVFILQVRPLAMRDAIAQQKNVSVTSAIADIHSELRRRMTPHPDLYGETTIFGEMPDWNPAEMIGTAPRPLALSLYKRLITESVWRESRQRLGYKSLPDIPLLVDFFGRPFIDVRASLNSFLPAGIDPSFASQLISYQLGLLAERPEHHDKIEFEIAVTCRDFEFSSRAERLRQAGFAAADIAKFETLLAQVTSRALEEHGHEHRRLEKLIEKMAPGREAAKRLPSHERIRSLLTDCAGYGTGPFADLARHAFIGASLLRSMMARGALDASDVDQFQRSIHTVTTDFVHDINAYVVGKNSLQNFLLIYGHLRPGTYDINSWRYDERPELYLGLSKVHQVELEQFSLDETKRANIGKLLDEARYNVSPEDLLAFIASSIRMREWAKFHFSHNISEVLAVLCEWGSREGLSRDDVSYLPIDSILAGRRDLSEIISEMKGRQQITRAIRLAHVLTMPEDAYVVRLPLGQPNFITSKVVTAEAIVLESGEVSIDNKIVLVESADPGFDWIFSHELAGLITKFGGANSHMSIRCAEFGIPAAIGCGERMYANLAKSRVIELNAGARHIRPIR